MQTPKNNEGFKEKSNFEINLVALALSQKHPGRVAELLGYIPEGSFVDDVYSQLSIPRSNNY